MLRPSNRDLLCQTGEAAFIPAAMFDGITLLFPTMPPAVSRVVIILKMAEPRHGLYLVLAAEAVDPT
tara:strand:- start:1710 stop:1910 length:201 start_codon:yes stop_codon:yes gene_type:complete